MAPKADLKAQVLEKFEENADIVQRATKALTEVLKREPDAVLIAYEANGRVGCVAVPSSFALAKGLSEMVFDLLHPDDTEEE